MYVFTHCIWGSIEGGFHYCVGGISGKKYSFEKSRDAA
jgi:hypothetical protein